MMKIVTAQEMGRIEKVAYAEGASEETFMQSAGSGVAEKAQQLIAENHLKPNIILLCGSGNNAGDAYVAGRILRAGGFVVQAIALAPFDKSSPLCQKQSRRFQDEGGPIHYVNSADEIDWQDGALILDAILGTGFHGEVKGLFKAAIEKANQSGIPILAIDIPSGINGSTGSVGGSAIQATVTLFLGLPKSGCFTQEAWDYVGKISVYNFGLEDKYIEAAEAEYLLIDEPLIHSYLPKIKRTRHKYQAGYVVGLGGSPGMPGAPLMSSFAVLKAGAGIVRLLHPRGMEAELAMAPPEIIRQGYGENEIDLIFNAMARASAVFIGPGIGTSNSTLSILQALLPRLDKPCVIDAEALTLISEHEIALPPQTIMTPHHGEMERLLHAPKEITFQELLTRSQAYAEQKKITLVLKGAPTYIFQPGSKPYISSRGDPGMATAGAGDVLTGIIAAFLAQTHIPLHAALLGVHLHSLAGECAAAALTSYSMTATDITAHLPQAFKSLLK